MTLGFPNPSRSFNEPRHAVSFVGHDGVFEVGFFVEAGALVKAASELRDATDLEAQCLAAFDARRDSIHDAARKAYARGRQTSYMLTAVDLK
jgi:Protein of unknown function (DUF1488)